MKNICKRYEFLRETKNFYRFQRKKDLDEVFMPTTVYCHKDLFKKGKPKAVKIVVTEDD